MKQRVMLLVLLVTALLTLVSASGAQDATPDAPMTKEELEAKLGWVCPDGFQGQTLSVYNWSTYIADDTISNFELLCGVTVTYDVYEGNEALMARLRQGNPGYDVAVPSDYAVATLAAEGLLMELDHTLLPNLVNVSPDLLNPPYDPELTYSVPYLWGTMGIGYNRTKVGEITSWSQVFGYPDRAVAWLDDPRAMMGVALLLLDKDPNSDSADDINAARDFLIGSGANVLTIATDDGQALLERGDADIVVEYSGDVFQVIANCACDDFAYVIPEEGSNIWVDNLVIPTDAPNPALAHVFIDYVLGAQVAADIANYVQYASPNQAAIDGALIDDELLSNPAIYPSDDVRANLFFIAQLPDAELLYTDAWDQVKINIGG